MECLTLRLLFPLRDETLPEGLRLVALAQSLEQQLRLEESIIPWERAALLGMPEAQMRLFEICSQQALHTEDVHLAGIGLFWLVQCARSYYPTAATLLAEYISLMVCESYSGCYHYKNIIDFFWGVSASAYTHVERMHKYRAFREWEKLNFKIPVPKGMVWEEFIKHRDKFASYVLSGEVHNQTDWHALVGWLYDTGYGVTKDLEKAKHHYRLAALRLHPHAIARSLVLGTLGEEDRTSIARNLSGGGNLKVLLVGWTPGFEVLRSFLGPQVNTDDPMPAAAESGCLWAIVECLSRRGWQKMRHQASSTLFGMAALACEPRLLFQEHELKAGVDPEEAIRRWIDQSGRAINNLARIVYYTLSRYYDTATEQYIPLLPASVRFPPLRSDVNFVGFSSRVASAPSIPSTPSPAPAALIESFAENDPIDAQDINKLLEFGNLQGDTWERFKTRVKEESCNELQLLVALTEPELQQMGLNDTDVAKFQSACIGWERRVVEEREEATRKARVALQIDAAGLIVSDTVLGKGNFATVYTGKYREEKVAVKILHDLEASSDNQDFWREARVMHTLSMQRHPNILHFYGICDVTSPVKGLAIITELLENGSLLTFLTTRCASLFPHQLLSFAHSIASAMLHLSSFSPPILHRDLSARNILVGTFDAATDTFPIRVADFGLARSGNEAGEYMISKSLSPTRWTAPEVWSTQKFTISAEVWSFGITFWEIMTLGLRPYDGIDDNLILKKLKEGYRLPQRSAGWCIPNEVYALMMSCWNADASKRPSWREILRLITELEAAARKPTKPLSAASTTTSSSSSTTTMLPTLKNPSSSSSPSPPPLSIASPRPPPSLQSPPPPLLSPTAAAATLPVVLVPPLNPMSIANPNASYPFALSAALEYPNRESSFDLAAKMLTGDSSNLFRSLPRKKFANDDLAPVDLSAAAFQGKPVVPLKDFRQAIINSSNVWSRPHAALPLEVFLELLAIDGNVSRERFHLIKAWFAPLEPLNVSLPKITDLLLHGYFHGDISTAEAARRLSSPPTPCGFLLRFSTSEAGSFALSTFAPDASVHHYRIANLAGKYALKGSSTQYDSLIDLIQGEARALSLEKGCPCEAWTTFFNSRAEMLRVYQRAGVATFQ